MYFSSKDIADLSVTTVLRKKSLLSHRGIYRIVTSTGKAYVGLTTRSFVARWKGHIRDLERERHACRHLQNFAGKHGVAGLQFEVIEIVDDQTIYAKERLHWEAAKSEGYILLNGRPSGIAKGTHPLPETNAKRSAIAAQKRIDRFEKLTHENPLLTKASIESLYHDSKKTLQVIASEAGISKYQLVRLMRYLNIPSRSGGEAQSLVKVAKKACERCQKLVAVSMKDRHEKKCSTLGYCGCGQQLSTRTAKTCRTCYDKPTCMSKGKRKQREAMKDSPPYAALASLPDEVSFIAPGHYRFKQIDIYKATHSSSGGERSKGWKVGNVYYLRLRDAVASLA